MSQAQSITDIITAYLREQGLETTILQDKLISLWSQVMGPQVARMTDHPEIKDQVLYVHVRSAALKQQLFECRSRIVTKMNEAVGGTVIRDIRLL